MRIRWRGLELPTGVVRDESISNDTYGRFVIEPFERGFGTTVGNSLRRILLSSLEGSAITQARIAGADHEFSSLNGVLEDVTDIILNIKATVVDSDSEAPRRMRVQRNTAGPVYARAVQRETGLSVRNVDLLIATLTDDVPFSIELTVERGRGYVAAAEHIKEDTEIGVIAVDSIFSPVTRVRYRTEDTRVGQRVNYDRLIMEIWSKGTVQPEDALVEAAKILRKHLNPFVQYHDLGGQFAPRDRIIAPGHIGPDDEIRRLLEKPIGDLDLSVRASNCLEAAKVSTVGELVQYDEPQLLQIRSFGKTSLLEVQRKLSEMGLSLGMKVESDRPAPAPVGAGA
jgi:DNA-directed RNA polymerase subunit alpha